MPKDRYTGLGSLAQEMNRTVAIRHTKIKKGDARKGTKLFIDYTGRSWPYTALPSLSHGLSHTWWAPLLPPAEPQPPPLLTAIVAA